ncbi:pentatricopeptide repeat-containing protein At1g80550, mitochondrial-like [Chenopodium quinoa]|uniref:pentatricopeptide repeat-containing protein At1g80550, mitochondrial-like n=1 Tax=Chenopodium quinoa TaxID=63459 RepID=UPI000B78ED9D|nr:pentatricopeptide repeat-containing protein At1g80550, mitochondrial-like [Chenopodium quinoa]
MKRPKNLLSNLFLFSNTLQELLFHSIPNTYYVKSHSFHQIAATPPKPISKNPNFNTPSSPKPLDFITVCETLSSYNNDFNRALEFFNWVETNCGFQHNTETYNSMIDILGKFFEFDKCWEFIEIMRKHPFSMPNYTTFRIMFKRYISAHYVNEAIDMFDRLGEFNLKDETSFCNLIDALCEYKHVIEAEDLWVKRQSFVKFVSETKVCNMMLRGYAKMGWWGKCREFWEEMDKKGVRKDLVTYSIYMDVQCKCGKPWKALKMYKDMRRMRMQLDVVAYNTVIHAIGLKEGVDFSIRMLREMKELGCQPNVVTYNTVLKLLCENGRMKEAYGMLYQMRKMGCEPDVISYHCFFRCLVRPKEMLRLFEKMLESGVTPRMDTYVMLMRKFGRWGFLRPVYIVWDKMKELGCSPNEAAYNALIDALLQKGMVDNARQYDEEMLAKGLSAKPRVELGTNAANDKSGDVEL